MALLSTDNHFRVSDDRFLVMAAISHDRVRDREKDKVNKAWKNVMKSEENKRRAEFMQHQ